MYYANVRYYDPWEGIYLDAIDIPTAISEMYLDRNGIMCDNILEFVACAYSIMTGMSKDPSSTEDDANEGIPWWAKLLIGLGALLLGALVTALTAGTGTGFMAAFGSALLSSTIQAGISTGISAGIGALIGGITGGWEGMLEGLIGGAIDGFMWGGVFAGGAQILSGGFNIAARFGAKTGVKGGIKIGKHVKILSPNSARHSESGGTLLKIGSMVRHGKNVRIDVGIKTFLHINVEIGRNWHIMIGKYVAGILGGLMDA